MRLTQNVITQQEATRLAPTYVKFLNHRLSYPEERQFLDEFNQLKLGDNVVASTTNDTGRHRTYVRAKVTQVKHNDYRAIDGPVVRVTNGEMSWRVDGNDYAQKI